MESENRKSRKFITSENCTARTRSIRPSARRKNGDESPDVPKTQSQSVVTRSMSRKKTSGIVTDNMYRRKSSQSSIQAEENSASRTSRSVRIHLFKTDSPKEILNSTNKTKKSRKKTKKRATNKLSNQKKGWMTLFFFICLSLIAAIGAAFHIYFLNLYVF